MFSTVAVPAALEIRPYLKKGLATIISNFVILRAHFCRQSLRIACPLLSIGKREIKLNNTFIIVRKSCSRLPILREWGRRRFRKETRQRS